ncbi:LysR substrate-binding domain-containing protein [Streptomyces sp. E-15]
MGPAPADWEGPTRELGVEEFAVVLPTGDPLADSPTRTVALASLADRAWVHHSPGNGLADLLDRVCLRAGFRPEAAIRAEQTSAVPLLAAAGLGPALVPANVIPAHFDGAALRPDPPIRRTLTAYTPTRPDPLTVAFTDHLARQARLNPFTSRLPSRNGRMVPTLRRRDVARPPPVDAAGAGAGAGPRRSPAYPIGRWVRRVRSRSEDGSRESARETAGMTGACRKRLHAPRSTRSSPRSTPRRTAM